MSFFVKGCFFPFLFLSFFLPTGAVFDSGTDTALGIFIVVLNAGAGTGETELDPEYCDCEALMLLAIDAVAPPVRFLVFSLLRWRVCILSMTASRNHLASSSFAKFSAAGQSSHSKV